jgi:hypothetical protein
MRLCSQMLVPRQSLQVLLWRLFQQMLAPPTADMLADAGAPAVLSLAPDAVMLLADAHLAVMLADAGAPAVLAPAPRLCWQMLAPPQSLRLLLWLLCSHFMRPLCGALAPLAMLPNAPCIRALTRQHVSYMGISCSLMCASSVSTEPSRSAGDMGESSIVSAVIHACHAGSNCAPCTARNAKRAPCVS